MEAGSPTRTANLRNWSRCIAGNGRTSRSLTAISSSPIPRSPSPSADLAATAQRVVVFPVLLFAAGHVKNDIPLALAAVRGEHPDVDFVAARPLGVHPAMTELSLQRARQAAVPEQEEAQTVLVVGRGSSDPDANADFFKVVRLFEESCAVSARPSLFHRRRQANLRTDPRMGGAGPSRTLACGPLPPVRRQAGRPDPGAPRCRSRRATPWIKTALARHLGLDPKLLTVIDDRIREALEGRAPLPCDTCQYRVALPGLQQQVGGLRALLWSVRHSFTHTQAIPHVHAHKPIRKHVLVCVNRDCADRGSVALVATLRARIKEVGREADIKVTKTSCMGRCGEGPTVAVYPDGVWYRTVQADDASELVQEHLLNDRLVARLVDNILQ